MSRNPLPPPTSERESGGGKGAEAAAWLSPPSLSPAAGSAGTLASPARDWPVAVATAVIAARCRCLPPASLQPASAQIS